MHSHRDGYLREACVHMTDVAFAQDTPDGCTLLVRIHPGARRDAVTGIDRKSVV